jgi:hypothetical protein
MRHCAPAARAPPGLQPRAPPRPAAIPRPPDLPRHPAGWEPPARTRLDPPHPPRSIARPTRESAPCP